MPVGVVNAHKDWEEYLSWPCVSYCCCGENRLAVDFQRSILVRLWRSVNKMSGSVFGVLVTIFGPVG